MDHEGPMLKQVHHLRDYSLWMTTVRAEETTKKEGTVEKRSKAQVAAEETAI